MSSSSFSLVDPIPKDRSALQSDFCPSRDGKSTNLISSNPREQIKSSSKSSSPSSSSSSSFCSRELNLFSLLKSNRSIYHIEFSGFFSNHLPHALIALFHLRADPERLREYFQFYASKHLEPIAKVQPYQKKSKITKENWIEWKGKRKDYQNLLEFMELELLERNGDVKKLVSDWMPKLIEGANAAALHPLIHTGFGMSLLDSTSSSVASIPVVEGLAYCIHAFHSLSTFHSSFSSSSSSSSSSATSSSSSSFSFTDDLFGVLSQTITTFQPLLSRLEERVVEPPYTEEPLAVLSSFQKKMFIVGDEMGDLLSSCDEKLIIPLTADSKEKMVREWMLVLMFLYACTDNDFFILHGITSLYAFQHLLPCLEKEKDKELAMRSMARALISTFIVQGLPASEDEMMQEALKQHSIIECVPRLVARFNDHLGEVSWHSLIANVTNLGENGQSRVDDDHTIKLVWVCFYVCQRNSNQNFRDLAKLVAWKKLKSEKAEMV